ncbi:MAG TPA: metallophosphoesterase [Ilumatobacteraceae bacterium]|nr:metallophosphoesterase [Ilumatobacteraceae bacterium]
MDVTTVADDLVVIHDGIRVNRFEGLEPDTEHVLGGIEVRTLPRPPGELLCRVATVNDLHFGEIEAGRIDERTDGPIQRVGRGEEPYPETMNRGAVAEIAALAPAAVVVKGDVSTDGTDEEFATFERYYRAEFGERLHVVRGNHDAYRGQTRYTGDSWIDLPGVSVALLDTAVPGGATGFLTPEQFDWLDAQCAAADRPVLVMGHHQQWIAGHRPADAPGDPRDERRSANYFGIHPDPSDALDELAARRRTIVCYTAGHTHRHRVRRMTVSGIPSIEIGCVKDFPGTWAEYRVYEGGITQVVHRISSPDALAWSERCRHLYLDFGVDYEAYALGDLADRCLNLVVG